jgi:hypothetical protein
VKTRFIVLGLAAALCLAGAQAFQSASGQTPTPTDSPAPSPTPGPLGSISGRVYVDVNANGAFDGPDAPLVFPLEIFSMDVGGTRLAFINSSSDGTYQFPNLPPGNYFLTINLPIPACVAPIQPFSWVGDTVHGVGCPFVELTTRDSVVALGSGENATGIDFPEIPRSYDVAARIWADGKPLSPQDRVIVTVGGRPCWNAQINPSVTAAGVPVSYYFASLRPSGDPTCQGGDLDITINGRSAGATTPWNSFWRDSLFSLGARPLNQSSDAFFTSLDLEAPPFLGVTGQVAQAGTVTPQNVPQHQGALVGDGTEVRAFVGTTLCGTAATKALTGSQGQFGGNLFGLIVPPSTVKPGCGTPGASVLFCVGDFKARQPAAGPFSHFLSPEAKPVQWSAPAFADITLEPTSEPCLAADSRLPISLPETGGPP